MGLFSRRPVAAGSFRVTGVAPIPGRGQVVVNDVPQTRVHVSGLLEVEGRPPQAASCEAHFAMGSIPAEGQVVPAEVLKWDPLRLRVQWQPGRDEQRLEALRNDASAEVLQQLVTTGHAEHQAGDVDALGVALTDPARADLIAAQLAATLGTPVSVDIDEGGVKRRVTVGGGGHLSSAEAAELQRSGTAATATITGATQVPMPGAMLPNPEASLWDLDLEVRRTDGTTYAARTRVGFVSEARRHAVGMPGLVIPVRIDPAAESRVAFDSTTYDREHPDAPPRV
jgi:hypothetical protein